MKKKLRWIGNELVLGRCTRLHRRKLWSDQFTKDFVPMDENFAKYLRELRLDIRVEGSEEIMERLGNVGRSASKAGKALKKLASQISPLFHHFPDWFIEEAHREALQRREKKMREQFKYEFKSVPFSPPPASIFITNKEVKDDKTKD